MKISFYSLLLPEKVHCAIICKEYKQKAGEIMADNPMLKQLREKAMKLPLSPGVYIMKNKDNEIIYIGKAK